MNRAMLPSLSPYREEVPAVLLQGFGWRARGKPAFRQVAPEAPERKRGSQQVGVLMNVCRMPQSDRAT